MKESAYIPHSKETGPPLPIRKDFWRELMPLIKEGHVIVGREDAEERRDVIYAAAPFIIEYVYDEMMKDFKRPTLKGEADFYQEFMGGYIEATNLQGKAIWEKMRETANTSLLENPDKDLTAPEAALLSQMFASDWNFFPANDPFYIHIGIYGSIYEKLLKEKYSEAYSQEKLYTALEEKFPTFLLKQTATTDVLTQIERALLFQQDVEDMWAGKSITLDIDDLAYHNLYLDKEDVLRLKPEAIEKIHDIAKEKGFTESAAGRTEERGCPVLYSRNRDQLFQFAVTELIVQHKIRQEQEKSSA